MPAYAPDSVIIPSSAPHGFLIDMDGVVYRGNQLIPGAERFITGENSHDVATSENSRHQTSCRPAVSRVENF